MSSYEPAKPSGLTKASVHKLAESIATKVDWVPGGDIHDVIEKLGGSIQTRDTLLSDPESSGSLYVDSTKKFKIILPSHTSPERDRFTIAHEFGHFILHYIWNHQNKKNYPERVVAFRKGSDRIEWEANWFAAAFLMPEASYKKVFEDVNGNLWEVAEFFKVSQKSAKIRAEQLGLI